MTTDSNRWLEQLSILEQENALLKSRLETCEASCALLQAEVMCYRQPGRQAGARQSRDRLLEITAIAANTLLTNEDFDDAIKSILEMIGEGLETDRMSVIEFFAPPSPRPPHWQVLYEWTSPGTPQQMSNQNWIRGSFDGIEDIYDQCCRGQPVSRLIDTMAEPFRSLQAQTGVKGLYAIPISVNGHLWGVVGFDDCRVAKQRSMAELSTLKIAADCIGNAIERQRIQQTVLQTEQRQVAELAQANEVLQARDRLLETTAIAANTLLTTEDFDDAINAVLGMIGEGLDTDRVTVIELSQHLDDSLSYWRVLYEWTSPGTRSQMAYPELMQGSFTGTEHILHQLEQGQTVSCSLEDLSEPFRRIQAQLGVQALYAIPIFVKGLLWGVIGFDDCRTVKQRHVVEFSVLKIAADCIGHAIERQRTQQALLQAEQQRVAELAQANEVLQSRDRLLEATAIAANTLLSTANFDNAVNTALQLIGEALDTDRVKVLECMDHSLPHPYYFKISHEWVREGIISQISHPSSSWISGDGAEDFLAQLFQSDGFGGVLQEWPEVFWEAFEAVEAKAIYCVPIRLEGQIWGFLIFDDCREVKQRDVSELSVLKIAANCIGSGIQQQRTQQALIKAEQAKQSAILEERNRMAGELHDTLAQSFTGISLQVEAAKPLLGQTSSAVSRILDHLKDLAEAGLAAARQSVWALYPAAADYSDLAQLLYESLEAMSRNTATQIEVNVHGTPYPLPTFISMNLLRIGQEALTNALKHAQAQAIAIDLTYEGDPQTERSILLTICDDGCGFTPPMAPDAINGGFGLVSMSERCNRIGAQLSITSALGKGTQVSVETSLP